MEQQTGFLAFAAGAILIGVLLAALGIGLLIRLWMFTKSARRVSGTLVGYDVQSGDSGELYAPIVMYREDSGAQRQVRFKVATNFRQHQPGDAITLLVNLHDPDDVKIAGGTGHWVFPVILALLGILFGIIGLGGILVKALF